MPLVNTSPTSMGQNAPITPQPVPTDDTAAPNISATPTNVPTTASAPSAVVPPVRTTNPQPAPSKESFWEGASREVNPQYTTDAEGNVIRSEPARTATKKSILGSILFGALQGAARGMAAQTPEGAEGAGGAASAGMSAAMQGKIAADNRARAIAQQNFENQRKASQDKLQANLILAQEAHITQAMNFEKEQEPGVLRAQKLGNDAAELKLRGGQQELLNDSLTTLDNMAKLGIDPMFFTEHSPALTAQIPSLVSRNAFAIQNGQRGSANGVAIIPAPTLQNAVIPAGTNLIYNTYDGGVDKDGVPIPTPHALTGDGRLTAQDYLMKVYQGRAQLYKMLQKTSADMTAEQQRAAIAESRSKANLQNAEANALPRTNMNFNNAPLTPELQKKISSLPAPQQEVLSRYDNITKSALMSIAFGNGELDLKTAFPSRLTKGTPGLTTQQALGVLHELNPAWSQQTYKVKSDMYHSATVGSLAKQRDSLNNFIGHAAEEQSVLSNFWNVHTQLWNKTIRELETKFGGVDVPSLREAASVVNSEFNNMIKSGYAPTTDEIAAQSKINDVESATPAQISAVLKVMGKMAQTRANTMNQDYMTATSGDSFPNLLFPTNREAAKSIGMDISQFHGGGTIGSSGNPPQNQPNPNPGKTPFIPPPNSRPMVLNGKIIGYSQDGGKTMIPVPQGQ